MKKLQWYFLVLLPVVFMACASAPTVEEAPAEEQRAAVETPVVEIHEAEPGPAEPGPVEVTQEMYDNTLTEVRLFVENLNALIKAKNYNGWKDFLSEEFLSYISSTQFLASASESSLLKSRKIVLKTPNDYFLQVVVPSRSNSRVDEIEFTDTNRVKVFYVEERARKTDAQDSPEVRRLRLYELIKTEGSWKIND